MSSWIRSLGGTWHFAMEAWKCNSGCPRGCDTSNYFFSLRETDQASVSMWVAPSGNGNDKTKCQRHDPRMG